MKIFCIGRNYADHITELGNEFPEHPIIFMKPETSLIKDNNPFYYPSFSKEIHHEIEIIVQIKKEGKCIQQELAHQYYDNIGLGVDFTARDWQEKAKKKGHPWEIAKAFDGSAPISKFIYKGERYMTDINFRLEKNGKKVQEGNTGLMRWPIDDIISYTSRFITLKTGDILFTGTPKGVGSIQIGDHLTGYLENDKVLDFDIK